MRSTKHRPLQLSNVKFNAIGLVCYPNNTYLQVPSVRFALVPPEPAEFADGGGPEDDAMPAGPSSPSRSAASPQGPGPALHAAGGSSILRAGLSQRGLREGSPLRQDSARSRETPETATATKPIISRGSILKRAPSGVGTGGPGGVGATEMDPNSARKGRNFRFTEDIEAEKQGSARGSRMWSTAGSAVSVSGGE